MNFLNQVVLADAASGNAFGTYGMILIWVWYSLQCTSLFCAQAQRRKKKKHR